MQNQHFFRNILSILCLLASSLTLSAEAQKIKTETFFQSPTLTSPKLSPDGLHLAVLSQSNEGRYRLICTNLETRQAHVAAWFDEKDVGDFHWVNNARLVYSVADQQIAQADYDFYPGLWAVNCDGSKNKHLIKTTLNSRGSLSLSYNTFFFMTDTVEDSDDVFVYQPVGNEYNRLIKLNTHTVKAIEFKRPPGGMAFFIDNAGNLRLQISKSKQFSRIFYKENEQSEWKSIHEYNRYLGADFVPIAFGPDNQLYVTAPTSDSTSALYLYDLQNKRIEDSPILKIADFDFDGELIFNYENKKLIGIHFTGEAQSSFWFDPEMKQLQKTIDEQLPGTINRLNLSRNINARYKLVTRHSDVQPTSYLLYDSQNKKMEVLSYTKKGIDSARMTTQDFQRITARDGLKIPTYISIPKSNEKKARPTVMLIHGGPYVRGSVWGWDEEVQFLTSRGYNVIQPEFRGSQGFGYQHFKAGWKQWGLAMQDDIADVTQWVIDQGIADPKKICIAGASYGGYAALMGLAQHPNLYQCAINWLGVTDIRLMYEWSWGNDYNEIYQRYGLPTLVGDLIKDAEQLKSTSPIELTHKITKPVLLAYGGSDRRVPIEHGKSFYKKIKATNPNVEWLYYDTEGHGFFLLKNKVDFWENVEKFLEKNIGSSS